MILNYIFTPLNIQHCCSSSEIQSHIRLLVSLFSNTFCSIKKVFGKLHDIPTHTDNAAVQKDPRSLQRSALNHSHFTEKPDFLPKLYSHTHFHRSVIREHWSYSVRRGISLPHQPCCDLSVFNWCTWWLFCRKAVEVQGTKWAKYELT